MTRNQQSRRSLSAWCFGCSVALFLIAGTLFAVAVFLAPGMHAAFGLPWWLAVTPYVALVAVGLLIVGVILRFWTTPGDGDS